MAFQLAFAVITLAILTSAMAERVKISGFIVFGLLWTTLVYDPIAHWVWGGGWLAQLFGYGKWCGSRVGCDNTGCRIRGSNVRTSNRCCCRSDLLQGNALQNK